MCIMDVGKRTRQGLAGREKLRDGSQDKDEDTETKQR